jgi:Tfp pilus assembly protein PilO
LFREKKQITIFIVAIVIIGGFILFRYIPLQKRTKSIKKERDEQMLTIAKGISDSEQLPLFIEQLQKLRSKLENYEENIPKQRDHGLFMQRIFELMKQNNLREQVIEPRQEIETEGLICIPINMECKGELTQIYNFYRRLQEQDRLIRIRQIKFKNSNDFNGEVSMEAEVVIYYRTEIG